MGQEARTGLALVLGSHLVVLSFQDLSSWGPLGKRRQKERRRWGTLSLMLNPTWSCVLDCEEVGLVPLAHWVAGHVDFSYAAQVLSELKEPRAVFGS